MSKILVIEDEAILREEIIDCLTFEGYEAVGADDGVLGIDYALSHPLDLIMCDITMPRLDGYGVLLEIHANPATTDIPFIFVTARVAHDDIRKGMALGADDYLTKPFTQEELLQAVQTRLGKKAALDQEYQRKIEQLQAAVMEEREQRLLKAKLIAMFSHDFRNQLTTILSANSLVRDFADRLDATRRLRHMNQIEAAAQLLLQMLDDMLVVAQIETGTLQVKPEPVPLSQFLQSIVEEFQAVHGAIHPLFFESSFTTTVLADPRLLRQIAANLISNAIKYSPPQGEVHVWLDSQDEHCILHVQDQGIGIPEAEQTHLFDGFQRGSNVGNIAGTGLGLAIIKQAVDLQGGSLHLDSQVGKGTTVTVTIPYRASET